MPFAPARYVRAVAPLRNGRGGGAARDPALTEVADAAGVLSVVVDRTADPTALLGVDGGGAGGGIGVAARFAAAGDGAGVTPAR